MTTVTFCNWCPDPHAPDPWAHPGGQTTHVSHWEQIDKLKSDVREWSDIAYEMWVMLCNSTTDGHSTEADWNAARDRLRDRFHAALGELHGEAVAQSDGAA